MQQKMKEIKQLTSKTASEIDRRKKGRKASTIEKKKHFCHQDKNEHNKRRSIIRSSK